MRCMTIAISEISGGVQNQMSKGVARSWYRGTSRIRKRTPLGPYCKPMPKGLGGSKGVGCFLMGEAPLYDTGLTRPQHTC
jgi:hypothetical protein